MAGVLEFFFDFAREAAGQDKSLFVVELVGLDQHTEFAPSLDGEAFFHAGIGAANFFEVFNALDVGGHGLGTRAGARGANGVCGADEYAKRAMVRDFVVMGSDSVDDFFGFAVAADEVGANERVGAFDFVVG